MSSPRLASQSPRFGCILGIAWIIGVFFCPALAQSQVPASLVEMSFAEGSSITTTNSGRLGGVATFVQRDGWPVFSSNVPRGLSAPNNNFFSADLGSIADGQGGRAIDLITVADPSGSLGSLNSFTVCGWINCRDLNEGSGGNRIVFALASRDGSGLDLVQTATGALRIGINQYPDGSGGGGPYSSAGKISADPQAGTNNWVFFGVTYDPSFNAGQVKFYFGKPNQLALLDVARDYQRGVVATSGKLACGNFNAVTGARNDTGPSGSRVFRGLIDELRIYGEALSLSQLQGVQKTSAWQPVDLPPSITQIIPRPGATVRNLRQIEVVFDEPVQGVDAADLRVNGTPATDLVRVSSDDYVFIFSDPPGLCRWHGPQTTAFPILVIHLTSLLVEGGLTIWILIPLLHLR